MHNPVVIILAAGIAAWIFGAIWYTALGKVWQRAQGLNPDDCKDKKMPLGPLAITLVAEWIMAGVLYQTLTNLGTMGWVAGAIAGAVFGAGFQLTATFVMNAFPGRSIKLSLIDGVHWVCVLAIEGAIIGALT